MITIWDDSTWVLPMMIIIYLREREERVEGDWLGVVSSWHNCQFHFFLDFFFFSFFLCKIFFCCEEWTSHSCDCELKMIAISWSWNEFDVIVIRRGSFLFWCTLGEKKKRKRKKENQELPDFKNQKWLQSSHAAGDFELNLIVIMNHSCHFRFSNWMTFASNGNCNPEKERKRRSERKSRVFLLGNPTWLFDCNHFLKRLFLIDGELRKKSGKEWEGIDQSAIFVRGLGQQKNTNFNDGI